MGIPFQGQYDQKTFSKAVFLINKFSSKRAILRIGGAVLLIALAVAYVYVSFAEGTQYRQGRSLHFLITLPILLYIVLRPYIDAFTVSSSLWKNPVTRAPMAGTVSNQGICFEGAAGLSRELLWDQIVKMRKTDEFLALLTADGVLTVLESRFFQRDADWKTVLQWAEYHVQEAI